MIGMFGVLSLLLACYEKPEVGDSGDSAAESTTDTYYTVPTFADETDNDLDGYTANVDCDDNNPMISPAAPEVCDGVDNDCDGLIDDSSAVDAVPVYPDVDGDGYGDADATATNVCSMPPGYVSNNIDCDDTSAEYYPGAVEDDCTDPNDYNCDGRVEFEDGDEDGFAACEECNDNNAAINPDASEVCGNAIDDNCNGLVDNEDPEPGSGSSTWYLDADEDGYGDENHPLIACDHPEGYAGNSADPDDSDPTIP